MESWRRRCEKCVRLQEDYVEKWQKFQICCMIIVWEKKSETLEPERTTYFTKIRQNKILWKSVQRLSSCYIMSDIRARRIKHFLFLRFRSEYTKNVRQ
jgi:hypothetical protein